MLRNFLTRPADLIRQKSFHFWPYLGSRRRDQAGEHKADRLPLIINRDTPTDAEKVDVVYVPPSEQGQAGLPPPASQERASPPHHVIAPRHWHDPHDLKAKAAKQGTSSRKQAKKRSADQPPKQVGEVKQCRSDGLDPLLRKLNLAPPCNS
jgi:hypothetical protein